MSDKNTNESVVWADGTWVRSHQFADGSEILKLSILVDRFGDFIKKHKKEDGFINLIIQRKRTPDEKSSHSVKLDTWKPKGQSDGVKPKSPAPKQQTPPPQDDDLSF